MRNSEIPSERPSSRRLTLFEHRTSEGVELSSEELDGLRRLAPSVHVSPAPGAAQGRYDLRPGSYVGTVDLETLALEIRPKVPVGQLLFMVSYALDQVSWRDFSLGFFAEDESLVEAVVPGFVLAVRRALRGGVLQGYRPQEDALQEVRGRIRFGEQIKNRFGLVPPVEVAYEEFTEDVEENRLLKAALLKLGRMRLRSELARRSLRAFDTLLGNVTMVAYNTRSLPEIRYTRLNSRYRPAIELARLILRSGSFDLGEGRVGASSFLVDMNAVFEEFLRVALREELRLNETSFPKGARGKALHLDTERRVRLEPDLSWWEEGKCIFVGDAKYKEAPAGTGVEASDLYQLLAYTVAAGLPAGMLFYGAGRAGPGIGTVHAIERASKRLEAYALDLSVPPEGIMEQVSALAGRVRRLRVEAGACYEG